ncbi:MAG TPA: B12-binding domain-containing protein [Acidimicrobiia bacterium]|nr:B12-binding domain-containing protein [Acidimicrobiia bacterium]
MSDFLTLQQAAERLGVHYMTVYRYVRLGQLNAHKEGGTWRVGRDDLELFQHRNGSDSSAAVSRRNVAWHERLENRLLDGDASGSWKVIEGAMMAGLVPFEIYSDVIVPALASIGRKWQEGEIGVGEEHVAAVLVGRLIGRLGPRFSRPGRRKGTVVVAAPSGERHSLNLAMVSDVLQAGGYTVVDLGADLPVEAFQAELERRQPLTAVCIGVLNAEAREDCRRMIAAARRTVSRSVPVILGGGAIDGDNDAMSLGADRSADLHSVVDAVGAGRDESQMVSV